MPLAPSPQPPALHASRHFRRQFRSGAQRPPGAGAVRASEQAGLDEVWFTPTAMQPLKQDGPHATDAQRLRNAASWRSSANRSWRVCTLEIDRGGVSYTVDTLRQIHEELPDAELFFLIGADALRDVPHWKEPREIFRLATPLVVHRAGEPEAGSERIAARFCAHGQAAATDRDAGRSTSAARKSAAASPPASRSPIWCRRPSPNTSPRKDCIE